MITKPNAAQFFKSWDNLLLAGGAVVAFILLLQTGDYRPAAALFPRIVTIVVIVLCLYQLGENAWAFFRGQASKKKKKEAPEAPAGMAWYWIFLTIVAYFVLIEVLGFLLATAIYMVGFPVLLGYRRWVIILAVMILLTASVGYSFGTILHVPLPEGMISSLVPH